ncbi:hypothetical protein KA183_18285 [bacterium]|nr:hypothetical protein [bacterium]QQR59801.1 MAG: hypothetical protein IPG59_10045 [Candidatus Melainabacteria bacterium]
MATMNSATPGSGQTIKMTKLSSQPTLDDLTYMLSLTQKYSKPVEMTFKNAFTNSSFCIKLQLPEMGIGIESTLLRIVENNAEIIWSKVYRDLDMILARIKVDSSLSYDEPAVGTVVPIKPFGFVNALPQPFVLDFERAYKALDLHDDKVTGLTHFDSFVFFLQTEFERFQRSEVPLSIVSLSLKLNVKPEQLKEINRMLVERVRTTNSKYDLITQTDPHEYFILLHSAGRSEAMHVMESLQIFFSLSPLMHSAEKVMGAASIPETCIEPQILIAAAKKAQELAMRSSRHFSFFS